jgi:hypothetical protein
MKTQRARFHFAGIMPVVVGSVVLMVAGCQMDSNARNDPTPNKPGGTTSDGKAPDCYKGTGSGPGRFKSYANFAADAPAAPAGRAFDALLGESRPVAPQPDPNLLLNWGGGGGGGGGNGGRDKPC